MSIVLDNVCEMGKFYEIRKALFQLKRKRIEKYNAEKYFYPFKEFRVLNLNFGRQTGNTYFLGQIVKERILHDEFKFVFRDVSNIAVVFLNMHPKKRFIIDNNLPSEFLRHSYAECLLTTKYFDPHEYSIKYLFIDASDAYSSEELDRLIESYIPCGVELVCLL